MNFDDWKEAVISEIDERFSRNIEYLMKLQSNSSTKIESARLGGKIEGMKLQRDHAIEAIRLIRVAESETKSLERRVAEDL